MYALARHRVWLVDADGKVDRTYQVAPGTVSPSPGTYTVTMRWNALKGTDGAAIEHVVLFTTVKNTVIGFSAAVDGSMPTPDATRKTGGIREHITDGAAMWQFALKGARVIVVP